MTYPTRDEVVREATKCIDAAFAEGKHAIVVHVQIADAPSRDFTVGTLSNSWDPARAVCTLSSLLMPWLRACYHGLPESPLREADRIICDFTQAIGESEKDEAQSN